MNKPHAPSQTKFLNHLAARFPEVAEIIHARREKNGGRICEFVEMNALTKWLGSNAVSLSRVRSCRGTLTGRRA